ncbi:hypothetical protein [Paenibacillus thalictri]|uniref:Uncharacterized protein n=1 Tax=Paenibacillus thalictri TaxID=2527873 RepID=A0A4Q9DXV7_9BACL|nr:hypothetical protein [Paenibacillus thalictri]TBL80703.1 hypothetical protein EYB31_05605 [Paenibacillus thalictri]
MHKWMLLAVAAILLAGCQRQSGQDDGITTKSLQRAETIRQLELTLKTLEPPSMSKEVMSLSDGELAEWMTGIDDWTYRVLSSPGSGELDELGLESIRRQLLKVYSPEMAGRAIAYYYHYDSLSGGTQADAAGTMLALRGGIEDYELSRWQPAPDQYCIELTGSTGLGQTANRIEHRSSYRLEEDKLVVTEFRLIPSS